MTNSGAWSMNRGVCRPQNSIAMCVTPNETGEWHRAIMRSRNAEPAADGLAEQSEIGIRTQKMARLEAALFVAEGPLSLRKLTQFALLSSTKECRDQIEALNVCYDQLRTPFRVERIAGDYQLLSRPNYSFWLNRLHQRKAEMQLSRSVLETLSIVAYRQPLTRADVESVRGVQSSELIKQLMDRGLIRIDGYEDTLGRPYLYRTTKKFLELFGLQSLDEMPMYESLVRQKTSDETPISEYEQADDEEEFESEFEEASVEEECETSGSDEELEGELDESAATDEDYWDEDEEAAA